MNLSDDAKSLIKLEVDALLKEHRSIRDELNIYRWAIRLLFVVLLGGSVVGVLKLQDYLDDRIQRRSEELSSIIYGSAAQSAGDFRTAIEQYHPYLEKLESPLFRPSEPIRSIYYYKFLMALADDYSVDPGGKFSSLSAFNALVSSKQYQKDWPVNQRKWNQDHAIMNAWARVQLKYGSDEKAIQEALGYMTAAASRAERPSDKAAHHFGAAILNLCMGNLSEAKSHISIAHDMSPRTHGLGLFYADYAKDLEYEAPMWERVAKIMKKEDLKDRYERFMRDMQASKHIKPKRDA